MLWNCHRGIYRNDFYVNHQTYLSEPVINFGGLEVELGYPLQVRFLKIYPSFFWGFSSHGFSTNLLSKIQGWSDLLLQFSPFCLGFLVLLGSLEVSFSRDIPSRFFLKINDELPTIFSKKVPISLYHTSMIIVWYFYDSFGRGRLVNPLDDSNDTQISYKFLMWPQRSTPDPFLSIQHWTSLKELSSSPSMFSDLANTCGLKEDIPNPPSSPGFSPWALPQALALDDWVMKQGSTT